MRHSRIRARNSVWIASAAVVLCTALGVGLFLQAYASLARTSFRDRATAYAQAFASTAGSWIARGEIEIAQTLASFLVTGSVVSVHVAGPDGTTLLRAGPRNEIPEETETPPPAARGDGRFAVDVPLPAPAAGSLRMEMDASSSELAIQHATLLAVGAAALFDAGLIGIVVWALRGRKKSAAVAEALPATDSGRVVVGDLVILPARCEASFAGRPLRLTPKQFAVLGVLASDPGRVFTESEILKAAWPDSPYADARDIKQYVYLLRRRLTEASPGGREFIVTVPGFGYRLDDGR